MILDEVDQLEDKGILYDLHRIPSITMLLIANKEHEVFAELDDRVRSRLNNCTRIRFDPYSTEELEGILGDRVDWGLEPGVVTDEQVRFIADAAAGDARTALGILRNAAKNAQKTGVDTITKSLIREAVPETRSEIRQTDLDRLTRDQRILYDLIEGAGEISPGDLFKQYEAEVTNPKSRRTVRNYLAKMEHYNLIEGEGATRGRVYRKSTEGSSGFYPVVRRSQYH